jgi:hypothetical protein
MTSHRNKTESAVMLACSELIPGMARETQEHVLHRFRVWRDSPENRTAMQALEAEAEVDGPEWRERVAAVAAQFCRWLTRGAGATRR